MRGRKAIPKGLKVIAGTNRACREVAEDIAFDLVNSFPEAPQHLDIDGASMWNELGPKLVSSKVLQVVDLYALEQMCYAWQCFRKKAVAGIELSAAENTALRGMFSEFGMTAAARSRVRIGDKRPAPNQFAGNGNRPAVAA